MKIYSITINIDELYDFMAFGCVNEALSKFVNIRDGTDDTKYAQSGRGIGE